MLNIIREQQEIIKNWLFKHKIIIIYGARQTGKTTLAKKILQEHGDSQNYFDCEIAHIREQLEQKDPALLKRIFGDAKLVVIAEAQLVEDIGIILKLLHDHCPEIQIIATGSSSFDLANEVSEPLTGRGLEFTLYPFSLNELAQIYRPADLPNQLENLLIYGAYPEIVTAAPADAKTLLYDLTNKYLYKDILKLEDIKKPAVLVKLLQMLALQIGGEVSFHELATNLHISSQTVEKYIDLLVKSFVLFRLKPFSRNLRKEITKKEKIYFYDLGVRNSLISQFNQLSLRTDVGALWENFCIVERLKYRQRKQIFGGTYFWRTHDQKEIDYIEDYGGILHGYEFKWREQKYKPPKTFLETYANSSATLIHNNNFWDFLV